MPEQQREMAIATSGANTNGFMPPIVASKGSPPPLAPKPVPKPRRRLTIGGVDSGGLVVQCLDGKAKTKSPLVTVENGTTKLKPVKENAAVQVGIRKAMTYRNGVGIGISMNGESLK